MDGEGNILVVDCINSLIHKFSSEGKFRAAVGTRGGEQGPLQFFNLGDIAFNATNCK